MSITHPATALPLLVFKLTVFPFSLSHGGHPRVYPGFKVFLRPSDDPVQMMPSQVIPSILGPTTSATNARVTVAMGSSR